MVAQADSTLVAIKKKVRRLTASPSVTNLSEYDLEQYIQTAYNQDFPYAVKLDQTRSVYTLFTSPNVDKYPIDVNYIQGIRSPVYFEGIEGSFFKDREQFYNMWPRWPTKFTPINGDGAQVTFTFTIPAPFLANEVVLGGTDAAGNTIRINDDGFGILYLEVPNAQTVYPPLTTNVPGLRNRNLGNPGNLVYTNVGSINYVTGVFNITFPVAPAAGTQVTCWVSQYTTGRPYSILFWNNELTIRPVPNNVYKVELETYLTPVQFLENTDNPIINQWWQYLAYCAAVRLLEEREDWDGVDRMKALKAEEEGKVLERQGVEEIGQRNTTIFCSTVQNTNWNCGQGWY